MKDELPVCPVATMLELIDSKWKVFILRNLLTGPNRFSDLKRTIPGISSKALTDSLREMVADGLVMREVGEGPNPPVIYSLSDLGESMRPVILAMQDWGRMYMDMNPKTDRDP